MYRAYGTPSFGLTSVKPSLWYYLVLYNYVKPLTVFSAGKSVFNYIPFIFYIRFNVDIV